MVEHRFGGPWTEDKLGRLAKYLSAYRSIFERNSRARYFTTWYVDAFAGTGTWSTQAENTPLFRETYEDPESKGYRAGSAEIALGLESPFHRYLFIEKSKARLDELRKQIEKTHEKLFDRCLFEKGDANGQLIGWAKGRNWSKERAVVFLDPYGMQVEWRTVATLAQTKGVDLWYLFPLGIGVMRLLTRNRDDIDEDWQKRLDLIFGTKEWRDRFYNVAESEGLFESYRSMIKSADVKGIAAFVKERLQSCFVGVADGLVLYNSKSSPLYLLCFAASNERGARPALNIASSILGGKRKSSK